MTTDRRTMRNGRLERRFRRDGYVIAALPDPSVLPEARDVFERIDSGISEGYYASIHSTDNAYKCQVDEALSAILWPQLDQLLEGFSSLVAAFMVKPPTGSSVVPVHQDWNTKDETDGAGITLWIPLTEVTDLEGRMRVLPGSHRYLNGLRGSPGFPAPYQAISDRIRDELMVTLQVGVGEVLVMDGRVLHTTEQNRSGRTRIAAYINALPAEAQPLHYYRRPDGVVEGFHVDRSFFTNFHIGDRPPGEPFTVVDDYEVPEISMEELLERAGRSAGRSVLGRRPRTSV